MVCVNDYIYMHTHTKYTHKHTLKQKRSLYCKCGAVSFLRLGHYHNTNSWNIVWKCYFGCCYHSRVIKCRLAKSSKTQPHTHTHTHSHTRHTHSYTHTYTHTLTEAHTCITGYRHIHIQANNQFSYTNAFRFLDTYTYISST